MTVARRLSLLALLASALLSPACAEPPNKEMNQAQGAIDAARAAGAEQFATDEYKAAVNALDRSRAAVEQRDYRQALSYALDARERAQGAARAAGDEKARVRTATDRNLHAAELSLDRAHAALEQASTARVPARDLAGPVATVGGAERVVREARTAMERDDYIAATKALEGVAGRLDQATSEISAATTARAARRPTKRPRR
jgi:hypothetical protein